LTRRRPGGFDQLGGTDRPWTEREHYRFEDRVGTELHEVNARLDNLAERVDAVANRLTLIIGGIAVLAFAMPLLAPFVRAAFGISP
jgi:hypothetical protein